MIEAFTLDGVQRKSAMFDMKKLEWMNGQHLTRLAPEGLLPIIAPLLKAHGLDAATLERNRVLRAIQVVRERSRTTLEVARQVAVRVTAGPIQREPGAAEAIAKDATAFRTATEAAAARLAGVPEQDWEPARLESELRSLAESLGIPAGKVFQPIRIALTGGTVSEPVHDLLWAVGKSETMARLKAVKAWAE
jgi:glutamyl-tRNA synthetase